MRAASAGRWGSCSRVCGSLSVRRSVGPSAACSGLRRPRPSGERLRSCPPSSASGRRLLLYLAASFTRRPRLATTVGMPRVEPPRCSPERCSGVLCGARSRRRRRPQGRRRGSAPGLKQSSGLLVPGKRPGLCPGQERNTAPRRSVPRATKNSRSRHRPHHPLNKPVHRADGGIVERPLGQPHMAFVIDQWRSKRLERARDNGLPA